MGMAVGRKCHTGKRPSLKGDAALNATEIPGVPECRGCEAFAFEEREGHKRR